MTYRNGIDHNKDASNTPMTTRYIHRLEPRLRMSYSLLLSFASSLADRAFDQAGIPAAAAALPVAARALDRSRPVTGWTFLHERILLYEKPSSQSRRPETHDTLPLKMPKDASMKHMCQAARSPEKELPK